MYVHRYKKGSDSPDEQYESLADHTKEGNSDFNDKLARHMF